MSKKSKGKGKDYNNFDEFNENLSATFNNNYKKDKNNQLMKSDIKKSTNNNIQNKKRKVSIFPNKLNKVIEDTALKNNINIIKGNIHNTDAFYEKDYSEFLKYNCLLNLILIPEKQLNVWIKVINLFLFQI